MNGATFDLLCDIDAKLSQIQQLEDDTNTGVCGIRCTIDEIRDEIVHMCRKFDEAIDKLSANLFLSPQNTKEEKGKPPHTPLKEKGENACVDNPARTREGNPVRGGMAVPTLDEVKAFAAANGIDADTAEDFWLNCDATGWKHKGSKILNWRSMMQSWNRARKWRMTEQGGFESSFAHIDQCKFESMEKSPSWLSDNGKGVEDIISACDAEHERYDREFDMLLVRWLISAINSKLVRVYDLILENRENRKESIWKLMQTTPSKPPSGMQKTSGKPPSGMPRR